MKGRKVLPREVKVTKMWTEVSNIRYYMRIGGSSEFLHDVTPLRYSTTGRAIVSSTLPQNEVSIEAVILDTSAWVYGMTLTPSYLQ